MKRQDAYWQQVELLLQILPKINRYDCFALKGGIAINLFLRNMPRLSVDIDLTYLPIEPRDLFLTNIRQQLLNLSKDIQQTINHCSINYSYTKQAGELTKLIVKRKGVEVKIEPNLIFRGNVFECHEQEVCSKAYEQFFLSPRIKMMSFEDIGE